MGRATFKKQITSPEILARVDKENQQLMRVFLKEKSRKCSDETLRQYQSALNIFFAWNVLYNDNKFYPLIKKLEISSFFDYILNDLKVNGKRFAFFKSVLSGMSDCVIKFYDEDERCKTFRNFIGAIIENVPKADAREKTVMTEEDVNKLFNYLNANNKTQSACLLALACFSGMRISELVQARIDWFDDNRLAYDGLFYKTPTMRTKGSGKIGKVIDRLVLYDLFKPYLEKWLQERERIIKDKGRSHDMLFINTQGDPASQEVIRTMVSKWEKIINKPSYPHMCRHYFTTTLKNKYKCSDEFVKTIVRWSSIDLVNTYNDTAEEDIEWEEIGQMKNLINQS